MTSERAAAHARASELLLILSIYDQSQASKPEFEVLSVFTGAALSAGRWSFHSNKAARSIQWVDSSTLNVEEQRPVPRIRRRV